MQNQLDCAGIKKKSFSNDTRAQTHLEKSPEKSCAFFKKNQKISPEPMRNNTHCASSVWWGETREGKGQNQHFREKAIGYLTTGGLVFFCKLYRKNTLTIN